MSGVPIKHVIARRNWAWGAFLILPALLPCLVRGEQNDQEIDDTAITNAVERELITADDVAADRIDVETHEGIIELSGSTTNLLAKRFATREAESVKGVRAVINRVQVRSSGLSDSQIQANVLTALAGDPATDTWEITVEVDDGTATLNGTVDSYAERELAERVTAGARGIRGIENALRVDYDGTRTDAQIKHDVEGRLAASAHIDEGLIDVEVKGGKVILSGSVGSAAEKTQARSKAWVAGVRIVDTDNLDVAWWLRDDMQRKTSFTSVDDARIKEAIEDAFFHDPRVSSFDPTVAVVLGTVTLTGVVDNLKAKRAAEADARNTKGVWRVHNYLRVRGVDEPDDEAVLAGVNEVLRSDVFIDRHEITVTVYNGHVYLRGTVDSQFEKERAGEVASGVDGVVAVSNKLTIHDDFDSVSSDLELKADIESHFWWSPYVDLDQVDVTVVDGVATLTGTVDNWTEWGAARDNAIEAGAQRVINQLKVE